MAQKKHVRVMQPKLLDGYKPVKCRVHEKNTNFKNFEDMKKNIRNCKVNGNQFAYVLDAINVTDYDGNEMEATDKERVKYFFEKFESEFNKYNKSRASLQDKIADYIQGLPSCINIAFENYKIAEIGKSWGYCKTERKENEFINNWFSVIAFRLIQLKEYFNL